MYVRHAARSKTRLHDRGHTYRYHNNLAVTDRGLGYILNILASLQPNKWRLRRHLIRGPIQLGNSMQILARLASIVAISGCVVTYYGIASIRVYAYTRA